MRSVFFPTFFPSVGRTGRLGTKGHVTNFVTKGDEKIGGALQNALEKGESLEFIDLSGVSIPGASVFLVTFFLFSFSMRNEERLVV